MHNKDTGEHFIPINEQWTLVVVMPDTYPSSDAPVFELRGPASVGSKVKEEMAMHMDAMFKEQV